MIARDGANAGFGTARRLRGRARLSGLRAPTFALWFGTTAAALVWSVVVLGAAITLANITPTWWIVLPFGAAPATALILGATCVCRCTFESGGRRPEAPSAAAHPEPNEPRPDRWNGTSTTNAAPAGALEDPGIVAVGTLTPREREVLVLLGTGRTNGEIARDLYVANATVKTHVSRICRKLGARATAPRP